MEYSEVVTGRDSAEERAVQAENLLFVHCGHSTNVRMPRERLSTAGRIRKA